MAEVGRTVFDSNPDCPPNSNTRPVWEGSEVSTVPVALLAKVAKRVLYFNPD